MQRAARASRVELEAVCSTRGGFRSLTHHSSRRLDRNAGWEEESDHAAAAAASGRSRRRHLRARRDACSDMLKSRVETRRGRIASREGWASVLRALRWGTRSEAARGVCCGVGSDRRQAHARARRSSPINEIARVTIGVRWPLAQFASTDFPVFPHRLFTFVQVVPSLSLSLDVVNIAMRCATPRRLRRAASAALPPPRSCCPVPSALLSSPLLAHCIRIHSALIRPQHACNQLEPLALAFNPWSTRTVHCVPCRLNSNARRCWCGLLASHTSVQYDEHTLYTRTRLASRFSIAADKARAEAARPSQTFLSASLSLDYNFISRSPNQLANHRIFASSSDRKISSSRRFACGPLRCALFYFSVVPHACRVGTVSRVPQPRSRCESKY